MYAGSPVWISDSWRTADQQRRQFHRAQPDRLSTEAGISPASFYIYFADNGHLLRRLAGQVFGDLATGAQRWWSVAWRHNPEDVHAAMAGIIASYRRHQPVLVALNEMAV